MATHSRLYLCAVLLAWSASSVFAQNARVATPNTSKQASSTEAKAPNPTQSPSANAAPQKQVDYIVAVVNSEPITNNEVRLRLLKVEEQIRQQGAQMPPHELLIEQLLENLISERAQIQLARETGIRADEAAVDLAEQNLAQQNQIEVAALRQKLKEAGLSLADFRNELRNQILLTRIREREVEGRARVTDLEIDQFIREQNAKNKAAPTTQINLGHILVLVPEDASEAEVKALQGRAQSVMNRARAGEEFAQLARTFSDASEKQNGGQLGLLSTEKYPELFVTATASLKPGEITGPIRSAAGFHILKLLEKKQIAAKSHTATSQNHARHILLRPTAQLSEADAIDQLAELRQKILRNEISFEQAAQRYSEDGSARTGGDLGWANPGQFVPEFEQIMNQLNQGQISHPLISRFGVHLIQLIERRNIELEPREYRELVRNALRDKKTTEALSTWAQEVRGRAYVERRNPPQ